MRCYNGCPDDELAAIWRSRDAARARIKELGCCVTYFPMEEKYAACRFDPYVDIGPFCHSIEECLHHVETFIKENDNVQGK